MCIPMYMIVHVYIPIMPTSLFLGVNPLQNVQMEEWSGLRTPSGAARAGICGADPWSPQLLASDAGLMI